MTTKQEIAKLQKRIEAIVEERIMPEIEDELIDWTGDTLGRLATLKDDEKSVAKATEEIRTRMVKEIIKSLEKTLK